MEFNDYIVAMNNTSFNFNLFLAFVWFALVVSVTPGPNCTVALITAANYGLRSTLPHMFGVMFGFATLLLACALGAYALLLSVPYAATVLKWAGIAYLVWMGWILARSGKSENVKDTSSAKKPSFLGSAAFQFANPKAWLLATGPIAAYQSIAEPFALRIALMICVCALACAVGILIWAYAGSRLQNWLSVGQRNIIFNRAAGLSLALTALLLI
jgi:threonine/homoserine/homoserine lactone efflux protein